MDHHQGSSVLVVPETPESRADEDIPNGQTMMMMNRFGGRRGFDDDDNGADDDGDGVHRQASSDEFDASFLSDVRNGLPPLLDHNYGRGVGGVSPQGDDDYDDDNDHELLFVGAASSDHYIYNHKNNFKSTTTTTRIVVVVDGQQQHRGATSTTRPTLETSARVVSEPAADGSSSSSTTSQSTGTSSTAASTNSSAHQPEQQQQQKQQLQQTPPPSRRRRRQIDVVAGSDPVPQPPQGEMATAPPPPVPVLVPSSSQGRTMVGVAVDDDGDEEEEDEELLSLEEASNEIRRELLERDMLELAAHAERAAESGEERFSAHPCVYRPDIIVDDVVVRSDKSLVAKDGGSGGGIATDSRPSTAKTPSPLPVRRSVSVGGHHVNNGNNSLPRPRQLRRRRRTTSQLSDDHKERSLAYHASNATAAAAAATLSSSSTSYTNFIGKLSVVELRNVQEVLPSFPNFHAHLRTHLYRHHVAPLLFEEVVVRDDDGAHNVSAAAAAAAATLSTSLSAEAPSSRTNGGRTFQNAFPFVGRWRGNSGSTQGPILGGELVSGHHWASTTRPFVDRPPIVAVPPGLDETPANGTVGFPIIIQTEEARNKELFQMSPPQPLTTPEKRVPGLALADTESFDEQSSSANNNNNNNNNIPNDDVTSTDNLFMTPIMNDRVRPKSNSIIDESLETSAGGPDFVTPMRLRSIRRIRMSSGDHHMFESLMLPTANSISEDSPMRKPSMGRYDGQASSPSVLETVLDVSDSLGETSAILLPKYDDSSSSVSTTAADDERRQSAERTMPSSTAAGGGALSSPHGKLQPRSLDRDDVMDMSPIAMRTGGYGTSFSASRNSLLEPPEGMLPLHRRHDDLMMEEEEDSCSEIRKSATVDEPTYWSHHQHYRQHWPKHGTNNIALTRAFGRPTSRNNAFTTNRRAVGHVEPRTLYVRASDNDDFLNNFLYCSKALEKGDYESASAKAGCGPCSDANGFTCGEPNGGYCCTSILNETLGVDMLFPSSPPPLSGHSQFRSLVRLGSTPLYNNNSAYDYRHRSHIHARNNNINNSNWFRLANERFDAAFESLLGTVDPKNAVQHRFNWSFRAPALRKQQQQQEYNNHHQQPKYNAMNDVAEDDEGEFGDEDDDDQGYSGDEKKFDDIYRYDLDKEEDEPHHLEDGPSLIKAAPFDMVTFPQ